jgi:hypothetical protein
MVDSDGRSNLILAKPSHVTGLWNSQDIFYTQIERVVTCGAKWGLP